MSKKTVNYFLLMLSTQSEQACKNLPIQTSEELKLRMKFEMPAVGSQFNCLTRLTLMIIGDIQPAETTAA